MNGVAVQRVAKLAASHWRWETAWIGWALGLAASGSLVVLVILPLLALCVTLSPADFMAGVTHPSVAQALLLSLQTSAMCLIVNVCAGTPLAWHLARHDNRFTRSLEAILQLPIVVPPAVAGVALLMAFGRRGLVGGVLDQYDIGIPFTIVAVLLAQVFVSAPLYVRGATVVFRGLDQDMLRVAQTLGGSSARVFFRIAVPVALPGLLSALAMSWARSLGEFGATLMFAGNLAGTTQTLPLLVYEAMESDMRVAQSVSLVLIAVATAVLVFAARK